METAPCNTPPDPCTTQPYVHTNKYKYTVLKPGMVSTGETQIWSRLMPRMEGASEITNAEPREHKTLRARKCRVPCLVCFGPV